MQTKAHTCTHIFKYIAIYFAYCEFYWEFILSDAPPGRPSIFSSKERLTSSVWRHRHNRDPQGIRPCIVVEQCGFETFRLGKVSSVTINRPLLSLLLRRARTHTHTHTHTNTNTHTPATWDRVGGLGHVSSLSLTRAVCSLILCLSSALHWHHDKAIPHFWLSFKSHCTRCPCGSGHMIRLTISGNIVTSSKQDWQPGTQTGILTVQFSAQSYCISCFMQYPMHNILTT